MSRFHIGQRVRIIALNPDWRSVDGHEAVVLALNVGKRGDVKISHGPWGTPELTDPDGIAPLDDGYDGRELASWATCPWRPERESAQKGVM